MIIYEGPSLIDSSPIVAICTMTSSNPKTGNIPNVYILKADSHPVDAVKSGGDFGICGDCPLRSPRRCYVSYYFAPAQIYKKYKDGGYNKIYGKVHELTRIGAYGDPAAVPVNVWLRHFHKMLGYTHQWRTCDPAYQRFCMASCETLEDAKLAKSMGWRTFRTGQAEKGEIMCPSPKKSCKECGACDGAKLNDKRVSICILPHGNKPIMRNWNAVR